MFIRSHAYCTNSTSNSLEPTLLSVMCCILLVLLVFCNNFIKLTAMEQAHHHFGSFFYTWYLISILVNGSLVRSGVWKIFIGCMYLIHSMNIGNGVGNIYVDIHTTLSCLFSNFSLIKCTGLVSFLKKHDCFQVFVLLYVLEPANSFIWHSIITK